MNLIKLIEAPAKDFSKRSNYGLHILEPSEFELEQAIARANINDIDTITVYR